MDKWIWDAEMLSEEVMQDDEDLNFLRNSPQRQKVYREMAIAGKNSLERAEKMRKDFEEMGLDAQEVIRDRSQAAMKDCLFRMMEEMRPGFEERNR